MILVAAAIGVVLAPIGAAAGASSAMPLKEAMISEETLLKALADMKIQESLCDRLEDTGNENAAPRTFARFDMGPAVPSDTIAYGAAVEDAFDSVLEAQVARVGLSTITWGSDPPMELFLDVRLRLLRVRDDSVVWTRKVMHRSPPLRFSAWAEDGGRRIREEFDRAYGEVSEKAIEEAFVLVPLP